MDHNWWSNSDKASSTHASSSSDKIMKTIFIFLDGNFPGRRSVVRWHLLPITTWKYYTLCNKARERTMAETCLVNRFGCGQNAKSSIRFRLETFDEKVFVL